MKVLIAGAGLAGLAAARHLVRDGAEVTVFDARERAGGRVWTVQLERGEHAELGGEFIDSDHAAMRRLATELGVELVRVLPGGFTHRFRGEDGRYHVSRTRPWTELAASLAPLVGCYKSAEGESRAAAVREMSAVSVREWLRQHDASRELHSMADVLRGFFLADPDDLSVLPVVEQLADGGSPAQAEMYRVAGGNERLIDALVRSIGQRVLLRHRLRGISRPADGVIAHVDDEYGHVQALEGDAMVIALPATALAEVDVRPPLPDDQRQAIAALRYGCATKVVIQSTGDLFEGRKARGFATDTELGAFWDGAGGRGSVLTLLGGGSVSARLRAHAEASPHRILGDLCWLGMSGAEVSAMKMATWEDDPFVRGGYAYLDPAFDPAWRPLLARRAGRLVFAGEHTSADWQGYMNGAVESGVRAAHELLEKPPQ